MKNASGYLASVFAFTLFFPSVALFNIGEHTGFQLAGFFAILYILVTRNMRINLSFLRWYSLIFFAVFIQVAYFGIYGLDSPIYYKNLVNIIFSLFMIYVGYKIANNNFSNFSRGFLIGGIVSGSFAIFQYIFWMIIKYDFPPLRGINNCNSFAMAGSIPDILRYGRVFGFAPEPSIFALLMIVALVIAIEQKKIFCAVVIGFATLLSMSLSSLSLILVYIIYRFRASLIFKILVALLLFISMFMIKNIIENVDYSQVILSNVNLWDRLLYLSHGGSFISRMNSIFIAADAVLIHPLTGMGYSEVLNDLILENTIESVELNSGINSLLALLAMVFGIPITIIILYTLFKLLLFSDEKGYLVFLSCVMTIPSLLSVGYYTFYLPWVGLGFASSVVFSSHFIKVSSSKLISAQKKGFCR